MLLEELENLRRDFQSSCQFIWIYKDSFAEENIVINEMGASIKCSYKDKTIFIGLQRV